LNGRTQPTLAIGVVPRERYSIAARAIQSIFEHTKLDFELIVVDNCTPSRYWSEIEGVLAGHENVRIIRTDEVLMPSPCKQLIAEVCTQELICLTENDVIVTEGWLPPLIEALQERSADVVAPLVLEDSIDTAHGDMNVGRLSFRESDEGISLEIVPDVENSQELGQLEGISEVEVAENHCLLFRTEVVCRLKPFEEPLSTREFIDSSLILKQAGARVVFQPASRVIFMSPPPVEPDEMRFYMDKWNLDRAAWSHERIKEKWGVVSIPESFHFVRDRLQRRSRWRWAWFMFRQNLRRQASGLYRRVAQNG
jgi:GT2 family glycosyltransferase